MLWWVVGLGALTVLIAILLRFGGGPVDGPE